MKFKLLFLRGGEWVELPNENDRTQGENVRLVSESGGMIEQAYHSEIFAPILQAPIITQLAFINRLTEDEYVAIDLASDGNTVTASKLRRFIKQIELAGQIDLSKPSVIDGINTLVPFGLLTAERANEILTAEVQPHERA